MILFSSSPEKVPEKAWDYVSAKEMSDCELAVLKFLNKKLDCAAHRNAFYRKFAEYKGDIMGATLRDMVKKRDSQQISDRRYHLRKF